MPKKVSPRDIGNFQIFESEESEAQIRDDLRLTDDEKIGESEAKDEDDVDEIQKTILTQMLLILVTRLENISINNYQTPFGFKEIRIMAPFLTRIDQGMCTSLNEIH